MTIVTEAHIDSVYDAITMMRLSSQILSQGEVDDRLAGELSWMLGSVKVRLEPVINLLEHMQNEQQRGTNVGSPATDEIGLLSEIMAITAKFNRLREKKGASE